MYKYLVMMTYLEISMKYFTFLLFVLGSNFFVNAQNTDPNCVKSIRIVVKPNCPENEVLFLKKEIDLITLISNLVESNKLKIYKEEGFELEKKMIPIPEVEYYIDTETKDTLDIIDRKDYFEVMEDSASSPIINSVGGDSMIFIEDYWVYVYPPRTIRKMTMMDIHEIRIQEILSNYQNTNKKQLKSKTNKANKIGFCTSSWGNYVHVDFWVDLDELYLVLGENKIYPFIKALKNKSYKGFQYAQIPCSE